jgi:hypothetical protein
MSEIVDVGTGDLILPIIGGPFDGEHLAWHPPDGRERRFPPCGDWTRGVYVVGSRGGQLAWFWQDR